MDIGKAFSFMFDDDQWVPSILIAGLISLIPIFGQILLIGYTFELARRVANGDPHPLPKWDNFGEKFSLGIAGFIIAIVYAIPLIIISMLIACIPFFAAGGEEAIVLAVSGALFCIVPLILILALAIQPLMLAATVRYLQTSSLNEALNVGAVITTVRADLSSWLMLWLLQILCGLVASTGSIIIIGFIFTLPYSQAVFGHLLGQKLIELRATSSGYNGGFAPPTAPMM